MPAALNLDELDLFAVTSELQKVEEQFRIRDGRGRLMPTVGFLVAVAAMLRELGVSVETPSEAWQAWKLLFDRLHDIQKQNESHAVLAYWYGINPFGLTVDQRTSLLANLDRMKAQDTLHSGNYDPADPELVYSLVLVATGDEAKARRARGDAIENLIAKRSGEA